MTYHPDEGEKQGLLEVRRPMAPSKLWSPVRPTQPRRQGSELGSRQMVD